MQELMVQGIGFVGVILMVLSYQFKESRSLLVFQTLGSSMFFIQFLLMGAYIGAINLVIGLVRNMLVMNRKRIPWADNWWVCMGLIGVSFVSLVLFWDGPICLLPFLALAGSSIGFWTGSPQYIRLANLVCASPCWLLYDMLIVSWGGMTCEIVTTASSLISIYRFGWKALGTAYQQ